MVREHRVSLKDPLGIQLATYFGIVIKSGSDIINIFPEHSVFYVYLCYGYCVGVSSVTRCFSQQLGHC